MFIMGIQRGKFTPEFKDEAVKLVVNTGRPAATVARELDIVEQTLGKWVATYRAGQADGDGALNESERAELVRLCKKNADLKMDRAFLKKRPSSTPEEASDTNEKRSR
jgi:transposase